MNAIFFHMDGDSHYGHVYAEILIREFLIVGSHTAGNSVQRYSDFRMIRNF